MAVTKVTTKVIADDAVTIDKINDSALVTEAEGISSNDNDTTVPTSAAVKDYVDTEVAGLVDSAPGTLDTLNELAAALGDDANFSTTVTNSIATKQNELTASTGIDITSDVISITNTAVTAGTYGDANNTPQITVDAQGRLTSVTTVTTAGSGGGGGGTLDIEQDTFNGDGSTVAFTLTSSADNENNLQVFIDGVYQSKDNFSVSGTTLTFTTAPNTGTDNIEVMHLKSVVGKVRIDSFTGDGSDTTFDLANTISAENNTQVFIDGVYQSKDNYSTSGTTVTFSTAPPNGSAIEVVHIVPDSAGGGISWDSTVKTSAFTAVAGEGYFVNTTSAAITVTLPSSPSAGDEVTIVDYAGTADTNNITITSSDNINGSSNDVFINYERGGVSMVYVDATQGWVAYNAANETATALDASPASTLDVLDFFNDSSAIALWKLDGNDTDESGNYTGTSETNVTYATGKFGQCASFNNNGYIRIPAVSPKTISFWFKPDDFSSTHGLFGNTNTTANFIYAPTASSITVSGTTFSTSNMGTSDFQHICITENSGTLYLYLNGVQQDTAKSQSLSSYTDMGGRTSGTPQYTKGDIDHIRMFNDYKTQSEVESLYNES